MAERVRRAYQLADLQDLLTSPAASFLTPATSDGNTQQFRLFHQALNESLTRDRDTDQDAQHLWAAWQPACADRWADAPEYLRVHGAEHAAAAGQLPALISEPDHLIRADLIRLLPLLPAGSEVGDSPAGAVVRRAAAHAAPLPAPRRARLLALTAAHLGFSNLRQSLSSICEPLTPLWARTLGDAHQELTGHTGPVTAVAIGPLVRPRSTSRSRSTPCHPARSCAQVRLRAAGRPAGPAPATPSPRNTSKKTLPDGEVTPNLEP